MRTKLSRWLVLSCLLLLALATPLPAQAAPVRPKVPVCRVHQGHTYCLPTHGGSGITPPVVKR